MAFFEDADIDTMLSDFAPKSMVFGAMTGNIYQDSWDEEVLKGQGSGVMGNVIVGLIKTSAWPGLVIGSSVTVDGTPYTVRARFRPPESADGALTYIRLENA
jgi:hypothetical protein